MFRNFKVSLVFLSANNIILYYVESRKLDAVWTNVDVYVSVKLSLYGKEIILFKL